ncbi:peptidoglycan-binding protein [Patescibacteria group bacterium]|nr:peptidoglycan-binding protein [Patescibacteria group bacterium]
MENFKFILVSIIVLLVTGFVGYWAIGTIEPGNIHVYKDKIAELTDKNEQLINQVADLQTQVANYQASEATAPADTTPTTPTGLEEKPITTTKPTTTTSKNQTLINSLQQLSDDKIYMKLGSKGTRVGTVQTFLNIYLKTSAKIDNDFGATMKKNVITFQKDQGLTADGQTGPTTYAKMIAWLKAH